MARLLGGDPLSVPHPHAPWPLRSPWVPQVLNQKTWGFPACGVGVGLWLMISSLPRRRLVLNHMRGTYHFSIQGRTVCQGPMHLVYVRLALSSDGDARGQGRVCKEAARERGGEGGGQASRLPPPALVPRASPSPPPSSRSPEPPWAPESPG